MSGEIAEREATSRGIAELSRNHCPEGRRKDGELLTLKRHGKEEVNALKDCGEESNRLPGRTAEKRVKLVRKNYGSQEKPIVWTDCG